MPITHEQPKTTLDSLAQLQNEYAQKVQQSSDASKKRRYQRQLKQVEDAIKATKEGKNFNYAEVTIPPGFAKIPLASDGRPILATSGNAKAPAAGNVAAKRPSPPKQVDVAPKHHTNVDDDEANDDLIRCLEAEMGDEDDFNDIEPDPEEEKFNRLIQDASKHVKPMAKPPKMNAADFDEDELYDNGLESQVQALRIPKAAPKVPSPKRNSAVNPTVPAPVPPKQQRQHQQDIAGAAVAAGGSVKRVQNKELAIILDRQRLFKEAALKAKQDGNTKVALVYLRHAKVYTIF